MGRGAMRPRPAMLLDAGRMERTLRSGATVAAVALAYGLAFGLNDQLFSSLHFAAGVDWIFLPSGLRLLAVVVLAGEGALGIALASVFIASLQVFPDDPVTAVGAGLLSGLAPWLARRFSLVALGVGDDLSGLGPRELLKMTATFALASAVLHQVWYVARGHSSELLHGTVAMAVGDFLGALLVLYVARMALRIGVRLAGR